VINDEKSTFHSAGLGEKGLMPFKFLYPYEFEFIDTGFKYMGYFLKLNCYKSGDWSWLLKKSKKESIIGAITVLHSEAGWY
jgi:hypothetical protein